MSAAKQVLVVGPLGRLFAPKNFRWLAYTAAALRRLGHVVTAMPCRESLTTSLSSRSEFSGIPGVQHALTRYQQGLRHARDRRLIELARRLRPDFVVILAGVTLSGEVLANVKRLSSGPLVAWWVDDPWRYPEALEPIALFDHVFVFDRSYMVGLEERGARRVHFLPCACDETIYRPLPLSERTRRRLGCDVSFVAWYIPERDRVVRAMADQVDLSIWGGGWREAFPHSSMVRGGAVSNQTAANIYSASKIGLNVHHSQARLGGLNARTFELLASGLFEMTDYVAGLEELLEPGREVVCYRSPDEARQLVKRYLGDAAARGRVAARGRERVLAEHTYVCRMRALCQIAQDTTVPGLVAA